MNFETATAALFNHANPTLQEAAADCLATLEESIDKLEHVILAHNGQIPGPILNGFYPQYTQSNF
ncbi:MAG: hypothetical protein AAGA76_01910 [Pseudomonadota bacterium]